MKDIYVYLSRLSNFPITDAVDALTVNFLPEKI